LCGQEIEEVVVGDVPADSPPDLDTRPGEPLRSTLSDWVRRCPDCGYCAGDISTIHEHAAEFVRSPTYQQQWAALGFPEKAREFLCYALILQHVGQWADAGWTSLHAAWTCDDAGEIAAARRCREQALLLWERGKSLGQSFGDDLAMEYVLVVDLYRRTGQFERAVVTCSEALDSENLNPMMAQLLRREKSLSERRDEAAHSIDVAERR
jgi:hypothetical protein